MESWRDLLTLPDWQEWKPSQKAQAREKLFDAFVRDNPRREEYVATLTPEQLEEEREWFQEEVTKAHPDLFSVTVVPEKREVLERPRIGTSTMMGAGEFAALSRLRSPVATEKYERVTKAKVRPILDAQTEKFLEVVEADQNALDWDGMDSQTLLGTMALLNTASPKLAEQILPKAQSRARAIRENRGLVATRDQELQEVETAGGRATMFARETASGAARIAEGAALGPITQIGKSATELAGVELPDAMQRAGESLSFAPENVALRRLEDADGEWQTAIGTALGWAGGINALLRGGIRALPKVPLKKDGLNVVDKAGRQVMRSPAFAIDPISRKGLAVAAGGDFAAGAFYGPEYGPSLVAHAFGVEPNRLMSALEGSATGAVVGVLMRQASNSAVANRVRKMPEFSNIPKDLSDSEFVRRAAEQWSEIFEQRRRAYAQSSRQQSYTEQGSEFASDVADGLRRPDFAIDGPRSAMAPSRPGQSPDPAMPLGSASVPPAPPRLLQENKSIPTASSAPTAETPLLRAGLDGQAPAPELPSIPGTKQSSKPDPEVNQQAQALSAQAKELTKNQLRKQIQQARAGMRAVEKKVEVAGADTDMGALQNEWSALQQQENIFSTELAARPKGSQIPRLAFTNAIGDEDAISYVLDWLGDRRIQVADDSMLTGLSRELRPLFKKGPYSDTLYEDFHDEMIAAQMREGRPDEQVQILIDYLESALESRKAVTEEVKNLEYEGKVNAAFFENIGRAAPQRTSIPATIDDLQIGESFTLRNEKFKAVDLDPDTGQVTIKDGTTIRVDPGTQVYVDRGIIEAAPFDGNTEDPFGFSMSPEEYIADAVRLRRAFSAKILDEYDLPIPAGYRNNKGRIEPVNAGPKLTKAAAAEEKAVLKGETEKEAQPVAVETDPARIQAIRNSIQEGEMILKSGRTVTGRKMSEEELSLVRRSVENAKQRIGGDQTTSSPEPFNLNRMTEAEQAAEAERLAEQAAMQAQREKIEEGLARPMTGDSSDVGQGRLFAEDEDLFSGTSQERSSQSGSGSMASVDPGGGGTPGPATAQGSNSDPLVFELPEIVQLAKALLGGRYPKVFDQLRIAKGLARGVFKPTGDKGLPSIELRADIFNLVQPAERAALMAEAEAYAKQAVQDNPSLDFATVASERYQYLYEELFNERVKRDPIQAVKTLAHEIGHLVDYLPEGSFSRGNVLGRMAGLKGYLKHSIPLDPNAPHGGPITAKDRAQLLRQAKEQMENEVGPFEEIVRTILVEEPEYKIAGVTPDDVKRLLGIDARETMPHLYEWFAQQSGMVKKEIVKAAMRGLVDERIARLGVRQQVGTKLVEKEVRERRGRAPTKEEINARFRELLRAEIERRNLVELQAVRNELIDLSDWWRPGLKDATGSYAAYRKKGEELYADAFSVLINNPAEFMRRAPKAYQLWVNYLDNKPQVKREYNAMLDDIRSGQVHRDRVVNLRKAFDDSDQRGIDIEAMSIKPVKERLDAFRLFFDRNFGPIYRRIEGYRRKVDDVNALLDQESAIKNFIYRTAQIELRLRRADLDVYKALLESNLDVRDLDELLFHQRVVNERFDIANPLGWAPHSSQSRLDEMRRTLGPERFAELERIRAKDHATRVDLVLGRLKEFKVLDAKFVDELIANPYYATFSVTRDHGTLDANGIEGAMARRFGSETGARIFKQEGTLQEIKSPYAATLAKDIQLLNFAYRERAKAAVIEAMIATEDPMIRAADMRWDPKAKRRVPVQIETDRITTIELIRNGNLEGFYVPKAIGEMFKTGDDVQNTILGDVLYRSTAWIKGAFAALNYGFWPVGHWRDIRAFERRMPGSWIDKGPLRGLPFGKFIPLGKKRYMKYYASSLKAAWDSVFQNPNSLADEALRRGLLISREDPYLVPSGKNSLDRLLLKFGQTPASWNGENVAGANRFVRIWNAYKKVGSVFERISKIAGMQYMDEHYPDMPEALKQRAIHQWAGSPDFLEKGRGNPLVDTLFIFYNPWKQSKRAEWRAWKENPLQRGAHMLANTALLTGTLWALQEGLLKPILEKRMSSEDADDLANMMRAIPERDKARFHVIPLFWADRARGKVAYLALHLEEEERLANAALRAVLKGGASMAEYEGAISYAGGELPGVNPILKTASAWFEFMFLGQNPYDSFQARNILTKDEHEAGRGWAPMAKWTYNNLSANLFGRFGHESTIDPDPTELESILRAPVVSNLAGRWLRISNRGWFEEDDAVTSEIREERALLRLVGQEVIAKIQAGEPFSQKEKGLILNNPYLFEYITNSMMDRTLQENDFMWRRLQRMDSLAERAKLLEEWNLHQARSGPQN